MQIAQIGPWEFAMPEGMVHKENESSNSYFESQDGTVGLYVKGIELPEAKASASHLANYIQEVHLRSFTEGSENNWETVDDRLSIDGVLARSVLDLHDNASNYRVVSIVVATAESGIQITVHDYWCEDYLATQDRFSALATSIVRLPSAA